ncbi:thiamine pyrophosphate-dependent enzyme [Oleiharenicola sp. Vm1]|uniref:alpha-ketoacid dehydrogenase subunit alpha/beta n=1 Tax=Oleiharenicola sp. Vm1 TaxID=3398393 RepID=UPI0039F5A2CA
MTFPATPTPFQRRDLRLADLERDRSGSLLQLYAWMQLARTGDNRILDLFRQGLIRGTVTGGQGNESLICPLALLADKSVDVVSFSHRGFGGHLIWSGHLGDHLAQYFANSGSPTKAREGNIHHGDPAARSLPMISHLGIMLSNVIGAVDSQRRAGRPAVGFAFFGDGSSSTGDVHESLNLASVLGVPVVFVIENNKYAYSTPVCEQFVSPNLFERARGYGMEGFALDCHDPEHVLRTLGAAIDRARTTARPVLVEAHTFRLRGHAAYDTCDYMKPGEAEAILAEDPLPRWRATLAAAGLGAQLDAIDAQVRDFVESSIKAAMALPPITPEGMLEELFAPEAPALPWLPSLNSQPSTLNSSELSTLNSQPSTGEALTLAQAINRALRKILAERPESLVLGQDIGTYGGAFKVTEGLLKDFGRPRVLSTPLCESASTGYAIGLASIGHRPIEEFQFADFATDATTQLVLNAATYHFRAGQKVPLVLRFPCGGGLTFGSFHSQELESALLSFPGLKALYPSTPQDAFNALLAAYEDDNPVIVFEHKGLYRRGKHPVQWDPNYRAVWQPRHVRTGDFATIVTYGEMVLHCADACQYFQDEYETTFDLFDLRALSPLKLDAIKASVARTGRLVIVHEGRKTHGFGAELVARLTEEHWGQLKAAPLRIAAMDIPVPFAPELEAAYRPSKDKIIDAIAAWMG